jgi:hypothetical protein
VKTIDTRLAQLETSFAPPDRCPDCPAVPGAAIIVWGDPAPTPVTCRSCGRVHAPTMVIAVKAADVEGI